MTMNCQEPTNQLKLLKSIAGTEPWNQTVNDKTWQKCRIYNMDNFRPQEIDGVKILIDGIKPYSNGSK